MDIARSASHNIIYVSLIVTEEGGKDSKPLQLWPRPTWLHTNRKLPCGGDWAPWALPRMANPTDLVGYFSKAQ